VTASDTIKDVEPAPTTVATAIENAAQALREAPRAADPVDVADSWMRLASLIDDLTPDPETPETQVGFR
jgi:hypothetical protein